jgi:hemerythrin-like domain-containing protein
MSRLNYSTQLELAEFVDNLTDDIACGRVEEPVSVQDLIDQFSLSSHEPVDGLVTEHQMRGAIRRLAREYPLAKKIKLKK